MLRPFTSAKRLSILRRRADAGVADTAPTTPAPVTGLLGNPDIESSIGHGWSGSPLNRTRCGATRHASAPLFTPHVREWSDALL